MTHDPEAPMSAHQHHDHPSLNGEQFASRHLGLGDADRAVMLATIGFASLDELIDATVPDSIRHRDPLHLPDPLPESDVLVRLRSYFDGDAKRTSMIGQGYYGTITPPVVRRNVLENPAWYTAYTPYQPEISQGRLEALVNFQTMIAEICALPVANASLLDEATAVAEAMALAHRQHKGDSGAFLVDADTHPQTLAVLRTRAEPLGIDLQVRAVSDMDPTGCVGVVVSWPSSTGNLAHLDAVSRLVERAREHGAMSIAVTDLLACTLVRPPGDIGFDVAVGSAQRFGVPMYHGGPHAAFIAVRDEHARALPGRIVGVSVDTAGRPALRLALQTREQHIRRERATSNICTAQALLANIAGFYGMWHGPDGLAGIATRVHALARAVADHLSRAGLAIVHGIFFDTVAVRVSDARASVAACRETGIDIRLVSDDTISFSFDETTDTAVCSALCAALGAPIEPNAIASAARDCGALPEALARTTMFMSQNVFFEHRSEHAMLRYLRRLADKDLALDRTMIPLGSCTMKLNATTEMEPVTWPEICDVHPFAPEDETGGYRRMIAEVEAMLCEVTGYAAVSLQPNAGSQGEFAGLLAIRAYHRSRGDDQRDVCLIPSSAHGTNAASAVMAGMRVQVVACDDRGNVDTDDLSSRIADAGDRLAALMITYPSTHGVFESAVADVCRMVHDAGGQVYVDGANLNALVGLARPGSFGADVSHLNLHKTFCIPHGGGGPGVGPVAVREHLAPFLPCHPLDHDPVVGAVSAAPNGSAGIVAIPWVYMMMMGGAGLARATKDAILAANYVSKRLAPHFPTLYSGPAGTVAHECILDLRDITKSTGVTVDDVAKRLMDHLFHAPTMSFPVAGTLMVEPTESETLAELDRFCDAMIAIRAEIAEVERGEIGVEDSPLRHAPHTVEDVVGPWVRPYDRLRGLYPSAATRSRGYFPPVSRIDAARGDRQLVCTCAPIEEYAAAAQR
jgi:glycine dehydrogenase